LGQRYTVQLIRLSVELLLTKKKNAQEAFLRSLLRNEGNCRSEFYKYVKRRKGNGEINPAINDHNGTNIKDTTEKLTSYIPNMHKFSCDHKIREIKLAK